MNNIILIGFMGSGKTTLGKFLAEQLNYTFVDSNAYIASAENKTVSQIFADHGESYFRQKEKEFLQHAALLNDCVISTGAGLPCSDNNMDQLHELGTTIWLNVDEKILVERLKKELVTRPKLLEYDSIEAAIPDLLVKRLPFYERAQLQIKNPERESLLQFVIRHS